MKKTSSMLYPVKETYKTSRFVVLVTPEVFSTTEIVSTSTVKILAVAQGIFLKRVSNYKLNLELEFSLKIVEANFEGASCQSIF